ncbi:MAG TPA: cyclic nucleotide-binding domain-containing protein [Thermodesulfobacteriota bacterium]|nr:cyclic nucleotide-binding domain-containing protein [Thermodesulfobacteriota bacterium]
MFSLDLPEEKAELLREVLVNYLSELRIEIAYTQRRELRDFLKKRGDSLEDVLQNLEKKLADCGRTTIGIDRLRKVDVLQGLTDWELKTVAHFLREEKVAEGVTLVEEGEKADRLFILEDGEISLRLPKGQPYSIRPGKILGWSFLVPPHRYTASAETMAASKLLVMQSPDFYYLIHKEPRMGVKVMANLTQIVAGRLAQWIVQE